MNKKSIMEYMKIKGLEFIDCYKFDKKYYSISFFNNCTYNNYIIDIRYSTLDKNYSILMRTNNGPLYIEKSRIYGGVRKLKKELEIIINNHY